jgi:hypothetical protein
MLLVCLPLLGQPLPSHHPWGLYWSAIATQLGVA